MVLGRTAGRPNFLIVVDMSCTLATHGSFRTYGGSAPISSVCQRSPDYRCLTTTYFGGILSPLPLGLLCQQMLPRVIGVLRAFFLVAPRRRFWIRDSVRDHTLGTGSLIVHHRYDRAA